MSEISIEPIMPDLGVEIRGVLSSGIARQELGLVLRRALLKHHLLVLRARTLKPAEQISLASLFGEPLQLPSAVIPEYPAIMRVSNQPGDKHNDVGKFWHVDGTRESNGIPISIWHVIEH